MLRIVRQATSAKAVPIAVTARIKKQKRMKVVFEGMSITNLKRNKQGS